MISLDNVKGKFNSLTETSKQEVMELVAMVHYRNGKKHKDDSLGDIKITPGELRDFLSYMLIK